MADSPETRVLKDINQHLADISSKSKATDTLSPSESANLSDNAAAAMGNFEQLLDARLKKVILTTDRDFQSTFGNLKGFSAEANADQLAALNEIIDDLEWSNNLMDKSMQNEFLKEGEREQDLKVNMKTNDILEDILEKDEGDADEGPGSSAGVMGFLSGIFGGAGAGALLKGGLAFLGKAALAAGLVGLVAFGANSFLEGWKEAGEDASFATKLKSALGKTLDTLTLGLFGEDFFDNIMDSIHDSINEAIAGLQKIWDDATLGFGEKFDKTLASLSFGLFTEDDISNLRATTNSILESLNKGINEYIKDATGFDLNESVQEFYAGIDKLIDDTVLLFTDPIGLIIKKMKEGKKEAEDEAKAAEKRAETGDISQLDDEELALKLLEGTLTDAERATMNARAKKRAEDNEAILDSVGQFFKDIFDYGDEGIDRIKDANERDARIEQGKANLKARKDKALAEKTERLQQEKIEADKRRARENRKPDESGLFPPRNNFQQNNNTTVSTREDTGVNSQDKSLQLQQAN